MVGKVTRYRAEFIFIRLFRFDSFDIFPKKASHQWYESSISLRYKARPFDVFNRADVLEHSNIYIGNSFTSSRRFALCIPRKCASRFTTRKEVPARRSTVEQHGGISPVQPPRAQYLNRKFPCTPENVARNVCTRIRRM